MWASFSFLCSTCYIFSFFLSFSWAFMTCGCVISKFRKYLLVLENLNVTLLVFITKKILSCEYILLKGVDLGNDNLEVTNDILMSFQSNSLGLICESMEFLCWYFQISYSSLNFVKGWGILKCRIWTQH